MNTSNLLAMAAALEDYWSPRVVGRINDQYVKVAKVLGELAWHSHESEDEMFLVLQGQLRIEFEDQPAAELSPGDFYIVPSGTMHNPVCDEECLIALIEPVTTRHTGDTVSDRTVSIDRQLRD